MTDILMDCVILSISYQNHQQNVTKHLFILLNQIIIECYTVYVSSNRRQGFASRKKLTVKCIGNVKQCIFNVEHTVVSATSYMLGGLTTYLPVANFV